jgi:hypothetical protein
MATPASPHRHDADERDEAVERVRRTTRWVVASAVLGTGALVGVVAHELPARSTSAGTSSTSASAGSGTGTAGSDASGGSASTGSGISGGSTTAPTSTTAGATTTSTSTSGSSGPSVSQGSQQPAHAVTGQT